MGVEPWGLDLGQVSGARGWGAEEGHEEWTDLRGCPSLRAEPSVLGECMYVRLNASSRGGRYQGIDTRGGDSRGPSYRGRVGGQIHGEPIREGRSEETEWKGLIGDDRSDEAKRKGPIREGRAEGAPIPTGRGGRE